MSRAAGGLSRVPALTTRLVASPWTYGLLVAGILAVWHRFHFIGLAYFDDALYQMLAKDPSDFRLQRLPSRSLLVAVYSGALELAPTRSWALLLLGVLKTSILVGASASLLRREVGTAVACVVATAAALSALWEIEYTVLWPDSWMAAASVLCLWIAHVARPGSRWGGAAWVAVTYTKELAAVPTAVAALWGSGTPLRAFRDFAMGALGALGLLTLLVSWLRGRLWLPFLMGQHYDFLRERFAAPRSSARGVAWVTGPVVELADDGTRLGTALAVLLALGLILSPALGLWKSLAGRALVVWTFGMWACIGSAVLLTGAYEGRYALAPRVGLLLCGGAGWLLGSVAAARHAPVRWIARSAVLGSSWRRLWAAWRRTGGPGRTSPVSAAWSGGSWTSWTRHLWTYRWCSRSTRRTPRATWTRACGRRIGSG